MTTPKCPRCGGTIPSDDINVAADVAYCRGCNLTHKLSKVARGIGIDPNVDLERPPKGAWQHVSPMETTVGASQRSVAGAFFTFVFAGFWNGVVSVFVALALASTLGHLGLSAPAWFPSPKMNGGPMGVGMTIFLWLFLTPFIAIGLAMIAAFLSCVGGRTEVRIRHGGAEVLGGFGPFTFKRRRFVPAKVKDVRIDEKPWRGRNGTHRSCEIVVEMNEGKPVKLGSSLTEERRQFVAAALRKALIQ